MLFEEGLGYSAINTARSALSAIVIPQNTLPIGQHPWVKRFIRGTFNRRPSLPRYNHVWDVQIVLDFLTQSPPPEELPMSKLARHLVTLLAILSGRRCQTIHAIDLRNISLVDNTASIAINEVVKTTKPGKQEGNIVIPSFEENKKLCAVTLLRHYLRQTEKIRGSQNKLFLSTLKPYNAASKDTISRWIKETLSEAGIDISKFKSHSTRSASVSCARTSTDIILKAAAWRRESTFRMYYKKPTWTGEEFAQSILNRSEKLRTDSSANDNM